MLLLPQKPPSNLSLSVNLGSATGFETSFLFFWQIFCTSVMVLNSIAIGYHLPWRISPPCEPFFQRNHPSAFEYPEFVTEAVATLVVTGAAMQVFHRPLFVIPLGVVSKAENKLRLTLDRRHVTSTASCTLTSLSMNLSRRFLNLRSLEISFSLRII